MPRRAHRGAGQVVASSNPHSEKALFGEDFGARDPYAGEVESNFGEKVLGNYNTEHIIKPPDGMRKIVGLSFRSCVKDAALLQQDDIERLRVQCPGWKFDDSNAMSAISCEWKVKSAEAGQELMSRIKQIGAVENHHPDMTIENDVVKVLMSTKEAGGLTENDFIVAAKINELELSDLMPPKRVRFWA